MNEPKPHHHGNLRQALIDAGMNLLAEGQDLTLRAAAARAGVSHAAPAHHFDGLSGLLTAIATQAFEDFSVRMLRARDAAPPDAKARLLAICSGYLDFARENARLFELMFLSNAVCRTDPPLRAAGLSAYAVLEDGCRALATSAADARVLETAVWSLVHGFALLFSVRPAQPAPEQNPPFDLTPNFSDVLAKLLS